MRALAIRLGDSDLLLNLGHLKKTQQDSLGAAAFYRLSMDIDSNPHAAEELRTLGSGSVVPTFANDIPPPSATLESGMRGEVMASGLFDANWYRDQNLDVKRSGIDPLSHFLEHGMRDGRAPNTLFDPEWYASFFPDVTQSGLSPFEHYMRIGSSEARPPHPLFDADWYENQACPGLRQHGFRGLQHYLLYGRYERIKTRSIFGGHDATRYLGVEEPVYQTYSRTGPSIAVVAHVYYGDLAEEICRNLKNIPYRFTALFTVPNQGCSTLLTVKRRPSLFEADFPLSRSDYV